MLIILKTTEGAVCGGYTSKNLDGSNQWTEDKDAFVFNLAQRYNPNNTQCAIFTCSNGFTFGNNILRVTSDNTLNQFNQGRSKTGKQWYYDIEGDVSPLTNQK
jgi:hypothetical protein